MELRCESSKYGVRFPVATAWVRFPVATLLLFDPADGLTHTIGSHPSGGSPCLGSTGMHSLKSNSTASNASSVISLGFGILAGWERTRQISAGCKSSSSSLNNNLVFLAGCQRTRRISPGCKTSTSSLGNTLVVMWWGRSRSERMRRMSVWCSCRAICVVILGDLRA